MLPELPLAIDLVVYRTVACKTYFIPAALYTDMIRRQEVSHTDMRLSVMHCDKARINIACLFRCTSGVISRCLLKNAKILMAVGIATAYTK